MLRTTQQVEADFAREHGVGFGGWIAQGDKEWLIEFLQSIEVKSILEIGVFMGGTSNIFLYLQPNATLMGIDDWSAGDHQAKPTFDTLQEGFYKTTAWSGRATVISQSSRSVAGWWNTPVDLVYIDGDHEYESAKADISGFSQWVKSGGYLLIDDYEMVGVLRAVHERDWSDWEILRVPDYKNLPEKLWAARRKNNA